MIRTPKLVVNWYKESGKWYTRWQIELPSGLHTDNLMDFITTHQNQLQKSWVNGDWYVVITVEDQAVADVRFFDRLFKFGSCK